MSQQSGDFSILNDQVIYIILVILIFLGIQWWYSENIAMCNELIMLMNKGLLYPFSFYGNDAKKALKIIHWNNPEKYTWDQMMTLTALSGSYWRWILSPIMLWIGWTIFTRSSIEAMFQRKFTMRTLVQNNVKAFPCLAPIANIDILEMPLHTGPWRLPESPLQFAARRGLIYDKNGNMVDKSKLLNSRTEMPNDRSPLLMPGGNVGVHLNKEKTIAALKKQRGKEFNGVHLLPDHIKGLGAAFMAFGVGDKTMGQKMLDQMSLSYTQDEKGNPIAINISYANDIIKKYHDDDRILEATQYHTAYIKTWLISLLVFARSKGVLACSEFIWLRPLDRGMFYALNQEGGRRPWSEAIYPWVHYSFEKNRKMPLYEIPLDDAVNDLALEIYELGFIEQNGIAKRH